MKNNLNLDLRGIPSRGKLVVGFSAGADSMALCHCLAQRIGCDRIVAAHVNHLLRGEESYRDESEAREFCKRLGLRFALLRADVERESIYLGMGHEECGREIRYGFFNALCSGEGDRILTAHTGSDQAETMLLNLIRGAGLRGLCAIATERDNILRPMLKVTREEIEDYCCENRLPYVTDSSNARDIYRRNRIRHEIIPVLQELNPNFLSAASQTVQLLERSWDFIAQSAEALVIEAEKGDGILLRPFLEAHTAVATEGIRIILKRYAPKKIGRIHVDSVLEVMRKGAGEISLPNEMTAFISQGILIFERKKEKRSEEQNVKEGEEIHIFGKRLVIDRHTVNEKNKFNNLLFKNSLDCDTIKNGFIVRGRREGDRFAPAGRNCTKTVKKLFNEMSVPSVRRDNMIILESDGEIAFIEGIGAAHRFRVTEKTKAVLSIHIEGDISNG